MQVDGNDSFAGNGSLGDSIGAVESVASMKIYVGEEKDMKKEAAENGEEEGKVELRVGNGEKILCCKTDGKGWQCKKEAKEGHSLCEHHLTQLRNYNSLAHPASKKSEKSPEKVAAICRRLRAKKASSATNPHEFYYYSGFGPLWGKKRSTRVIEPNINNETKLEVDVIKTPTSPPEEFDYIEDDDEDYYEANEEKIDVKGDLGKKRARKPIKARSLKSLM
ncbi:hypothetical protein F0562_014913 [Nyssa sinensis]|uniref:WRC domain-containing protein n=1 Tax=Nyssa sinensis TaxID=561372 RepID=A0A5J4ZU18_9ASTE|nr:hypothetical protein F0562_014913 [Nyssa sinensis]